MRILKNRFIKVYSYLWEFCSVNELGLFTSALSCESVGERFLMNEWPDLKECHYSCVSMLYGTHGGCVAVLGALSICSPHRRPFSTLQRGRAIFKGRFEQDVWSVGQFLFDHWVTAGA